MTSSQQLTYVVGWARRVTQKTKLKYNFWKICVKLRKHRILDSMSPKKIWNHRGNCLTASGLCDQYKIKSPSRVNDDDHRKAWIWSKTCSIQRLNSQSPVNKLVRFIQFIMYKMNFNEYQTFRPKRRQLLGRFCSRYQFRFSSLFKSRSDGSNISCRESVNPNAISFVVKEILIGTQRKSRYDASMTVLLLGDSDPSDEKAAEFCLFQKLTETFGKLYRVRIYSVLI